MHHDDLEAAFFQLWVACGDRRTVMIFRSLDGAFEEARSQKGRPTVVIANTTKGCGVSRSWRIRRAWHHRVPTADEYQAAVRELEERVKHAHGSEEVEPAS